ncbi:MAG: hypothetical protein WKF31_08210 [Thermoleophilaceae bacterium]
MLATLVNSFRIVEIRKKLAFTAGMLLLYRIGAFIPAPGVNVEAIDRISQNFQGQGILTFLNLFSGGSLQRFAIFALGIMPYITASIILQLMTVVVPSLEKLRKEGEVGQQKITQYTRYLTVGPGVPPVHRLRVPVPLLRGQCRHADRGRLLVLPDLRDHRDADLGHDPAHVVRRADHPARDRQRHLADDLRLDRRSAPAGLQLWWNNPDQVFKVMMPFLVLGIIAGIVFIQEGQRRIPVQYAKRMIGRKMAGGGRPTCRCG